ncbi:MAG: tetratricopeptide repeat protein [Myxococcota bacterium]|nr:tetratricopeptide repeat protein [Myxococcota bacterium]
MHAPRASCIDVGDPDFEREVLKRSHETPVVVDFWAPWCGPCRALGPILEALAEEHAGDFLLARVDVDAAPETAGRFAIRSIPAVLAFRDGQAVSEFQGAQPEPVVRQFVEAVLDTAADRAAREGEAQLAAERPQEAEARFRAALEEEPRHPRALYGLARALAARGERAEALARLAYVSPASAVADAAERLAAELRTREGAADADPETLRRRVAEAPDDLDARIALGRALAAAGEHEAALESLLEAVRRDPHHDDDAARKAMLDLFELLGGDHPLVPRFRAELARALYR